MKAAVQQEYGVLAEARDAHWWVRGRRRIFGRLLAELVPLPESARVLDLGPGYGVNVDLLSGLGKLCVLDTNPESLISCRRLGAKEQLQADATHLPLFDESLDLISALDVIEHLDDDLAALRECRRVLKPTGWLLLSVPALRILWGRQDVLSEHRRRYGRSELRGRLEQAGFEVVRLSFFNTLLFPPILLVRLLMRPWLGRTVDRASSDFSFPLPFGLNGLLYRLFTAETPWLMRRNLPFGVSLLCLARPRS